MTAYDFYQRRAGVLLHPTSLPSGVLNQDAERWLEWLERAGFSMWQVLPLGEPQHGLSPYQCVSAFAMNPALYNEYTEPQLDSLAFREFCSNNSWLDDYALFKLLHLRFDDDAWYEWPDKFKFRDDRALSLLRSEYADESMQLQWQQFELHARWQQLKQLANSKNIMLFGDMPLFVAHDSVDVWICPQRYVLDDNGMPTVVTGVPPDYFSAEGQRWGNPHYNWEYMQSENFAWWLQRMSYHLAMFDIVRIDHFRGLQASWVIDAACETAVDGYWQEVPGAELLIAIREQIGALPIVAEDLGIITPEVTALRKEFHLPGMSVLQFGFDEHDDNPHKVKNIMEDRIVYTGTHDNDTTLGWYQSLDPELQQQVQSMLTDVAGTGGAELTSGIVKQMIRIAMLSPASVCMIPMQDILQLDTSARMNVPGTITGNWAWSFEWQQLDSMSEAALRDTIETSGRLIRYDA